MFAAIKRLALALAFVLPAAALVAPPVMAKPQTQSDSQVHKPKGSQTKAKKKGGTQKAKSKGKKAPTAS